MIENSLFEAKGTNCIFFALGRNAIYAACIALGIKQNDEILTPAFDCDGTLQPFNVLGCNLKFYRSKIDTFEVDIGDLRSKITSKTRLIHIINHFGFPQPWRDILKLRQETGIPILEDNAYSLFSWCEGRRFGDFGDFSIFSLRKNLPIIDGGMLKINNPAFKFTPVPKKARLFYPVEKIRLLNIFKRSLKCYKLPFFLKRLAVKQNKECFVLPPLFSENEEIPDSPLRDVIGEDFSCDYLRPMSLVARWQLNRISDKKIREIIDGKRHYYCLFAEKLANCNGVKVLWPKLPEGVVPFCNFLLIRNNRDAFYKELSKKYEVWVWPTLPQRVLEELDDFPEVKLLGKQLLQVNLPSDMVVSRGFQRYLCNLIEDILRLAKQNL